MKEMQILKYVFASVLGKKDCFYTFLQDKVIHNFVFLHLKFGMCCRNDLSVNFYNTRSRWRGYNTYYLEGIEQLLYK